jgi:hypothetical protein
VHSGYHEPPPRELPPGARPSLATGIIEHRRPHRRWVRQARVPAPRRRGTNCVRNGGHARDRLSHIAGHHRGPSRVMRGVGRGRFQISEDVRSIDGRRRSPCSATIVTRTDCQSSVRTLRSSRRSPILHETERPSGPPRLRRRGRLKAEGSTARADAASDRRRFRFGAPAAQPLRAGCAAAIPGPERPTRRRPVRLYGLRMRRPNLAGGGRACVEDCVADPRTQS